MEKSVAGDLQGWPRSKAIQAFRQKFSFRLLSSVGAQLLAIEDAFPLAISTGVEWRDPVQSHGAPTLLVPSEVEAWELEEEEDPSEPFRITVRRAAPFNPC